jgi:hypothetical protein
MPAFGYQPVTAATLKKNDFSLIAKSDHDIIFQFFRLIVAKQEGIIEY